MSRSGMQHRNNMRDGESEKIGDELLALVE